MPPPQSPLGVDRSAFGPDPGSLGRRVVAALIDMIPLAFAGYALSERGPERQGITLENERFLLWVLVVILFWVAIESVGTSVGKLLTGLRVVDQSSGEPPSLMQAAKRSVARVVDGFPFLYLVGFVTAATDPRRRRLGDRWADTAVVPASGSSPRAAALSPVLISLAVIAGSVLLVAADPGPQLGAFDYDDDVAPFAREVADAMVAGDLDAVEAALADDPDLTGGLSVRPQIEQTFALLQGARFVEREADRESSTSRGLDDEVYDTVILWYELDVTRTENQLAVVVADVDGELVLFGVFVEFGPDE